MARSDLIVSLSLAALEMDLDHARRAIATISAEERRKGHSHVADRLDQLLQAAPVESSGNGRGQSVVDVDAGRGRDHFRQSLPSKSLQDVMLSDTNEALVQAVVSEQKHTTALRAVGLEPRHRLLFVGPPGTGKTSLAEAMAGELGVPIRVVQYESVIGSYLGETSSRLNALFVEASDSPCVLFLDEFDTVAKERGDEHDSGEIKRVVSTLLLQLDALPSHVVLIAATNHDELLDRAAWRRFQVIVDLPLPDEKGRKFLASKLALRIGAERPEEVVARAADMVGASYAAVEEQVYSVRRAEVIAGLATRTGL
jgi:SpoVK/Ycf46/Vps4 family AAA+-type ATPase